MPTNTLHHCNGYFIDDQSAITSPTFTKCSKSTGCRFYGCPARPLNVPQNCEDGRCLLCFPQSHQYTAKHEGRHLSMTVSDNHGSFQSISIHDSQYLKVGETMSYPSGATILLIVGPMDAEG